MLQCTVPGSLSGWLAFQMSEMWCESMVCDKCGRFLFPSSEKSLQWWQSWYCVSSRFVAFMTANIQARLSSCIHYWLFCGIDANSQLYKSLLSHYSTAMCSIIIFLTRTVSFSQGLSRSCTPFMWTRNPNNELALCSQSIWHAFDQNLAHRFVGWSWVKLLLVQKRSCQRLFALINGR